MLPQGPGPERDMFKKGGGGFPVPLKGQEERRVAEATPGADVKGEV